MAVDKTTIKNDLPDWPDEVVEQWIHYHAQSCGWPPPDPLGEHRWKRLLGGKPLAWWKEVRWEQETVNCSLATLTPRARTGVNEIIAEFLSGAADEATRRRVRQPYQYIMDEGVFPKLLVTMRLPSGLTLIDGSHRMAAFEMLQRTPDAKFKQLGKTKASLNQDAWVGKHSAGELPDG